MTAIEAQAQKNISLTNFAFKKFADSTASVNELRLAMFAPVGKLTHNSKPYLLLKEHGKIIRQTGWGQLIIENVILTQTHRDILDCVMAHGEPCVPISKSYKGGIAYKFSATTILREYGQTKSRNTKWIDKILTDLRDARITMRANNGDEYDFNILSSRGYKKDIDAYFIEFSPGYVDYFCNSMTIDYKDQLNDLLAIDSPLIRAIVRLELTQKSSMSMNIYNKGAERGKRGLLEAVGYPIESPTNLKVARAAIREYTEVLAKFGIYYCPTLSKQNLVRYSKKLDVKIIPPITNKALNTMKNEEKDAFLNLLDFRERRIRYLNEELLISDVFLNESSLDIVVSVITKNKENKKIVFKLKPSIVEQILTDHLADMESLGV